LRGSRAASNTNHGTGRMHARPRSRSQTYQRSLAAELETLRLLTSHQGRKVPTVGGVLLFGRDRLTRFPDAGIQAGPFKGTDKGAILDHAELKMPLVQAIGDAVAFVEKHAIHGA